MVGEAKYAKFNEQKEVLVYVGRRMESCLWGVGLGIKGGSGEQVERHRLIPAFTMKKQLSLDIK
jgi:hypothetical protein